MVRSALIAVLLSSCSALAWLAEPVGQTFRECSCAQPKADVAISQPTTTHGDLLVRDAVTIGTIIAGPGGGFAVSLAGQLLLLVAGAARRKRTT